MLLKLLIDFKQKKREKMNSDYLRVGIITNTHGIKGELNVLPTGEGLDRFNSLKDVYVEDKEMTHLEVCNVKFFKNQAILKFKGIDNINDVEKYKGKNLLVSRQDAIKLEEGEHFVCDIIGFQVVTDEGKILGELSEVLFTAANDVYVVKTEDEKEILLPAIKDVILDISEETGKILVHLLPGLVD